jgi:hypothetical protein
MSVISSNYRNPWPKLPKNNPFILAEDLRQISRHGLAPNDLGWKTELLPVPYLGNLKRAKIILLCLNPGYNRNLDKKAHEDKYYYQENLKSLNFESHTPFYCLDPRFDYSGGYRWWVRLLKPLIREFGLKTLSEKLMCLQYLGYHSKTFRKPPCILPSQNFTFCLLKKAMKSKKIIVIMRSKNLWFKSVPELKTYPFIELKNYRMPYLTEKNVKNGNFLEIVDSLKS